MRFPILLAVLGLPLLQRDDPLVLDSRQAVGDVFEEKESCWVNAIAASADDDSNHASFAWDGAAERSAPAAHAASFRSDSTVLDEVLAVNDGKRVKIRRTFVTSSTTAVDPASADSLPRARRAAFEGQTAVLVADGDGTRIVGELEGEEELAESDRALSSRWEQVLPAAPVAVGDTWSLPEEAAKRLLKGVSVERCSASCTLDGVDAKAPGRPARIKLEIRATGPGSADIEASGAVVWSLAGAHLEEVVLSGRIRSTDADGNEESSAFGVLREVRKIQ